MDRKPHDPECGSKRIGDDSVQVLQELLLELNELSLQTTLHIGQLAICKVNMDTRRKLNDIFDFNTLQRAARSFMLEQEVLDEYNALMARHTRNIRTLQAQYRQQIIHMLQENDAGWLQGRRKTLLAAFYAAKDVHSLFMRISREVILPDRRVVYRPWIAKSPLVLHRREKALQTNSIIT
jgi:hypothetical protein